jgi:hypothetical protein
MADIDSFRHPLLHLTQSRVVGCFGGGVYVVGRSRVFYIVDLLKEQWKEKNVLIQFLLRYN